MNKQQKISTAMSIESLFLAEYNSKHEFKGMVIKSLKKCQNKLKATKNNIKDGTAKFIKSMKNKFQTFHE